MAKYPSYKNRITGKTIPKGSPSDSLAPLKGRKHNIFEAPIVKSMCQSFPENDPLEDEAPTFLPPDGKAVWTWGVATCHVICMYGWAQNHLGWSSGIALLHLTDAHTIKQGLKACYEVLRTKGFAQDITSYIIGGQPDSDGKLSDLGNQAVYKTKGIVAPLTTDRGGAALVVATRQWIAFNVYDETEESY